MSYNITYTYLVYNALPTWTYLADIHYISKSIQSVWKNLTGLQKAAETQTHHQTPMTCTFIICTKVYSLEEKKALPICANKDGNIINVLKHCICTSVASVLKCMKGLYPYVQVIGVWWWVCVSAAFCRPVKFFHTDWIIISLWFLSYTQRHCHVRIQKSPAITLDSLEYHYMLKH